MKEKFLRYEILNKEYEVIKRKRDISKREIDREMRKAYNHGREMFGLYLELGTTGIFGARVIAGLLQRYERGEKTYRLYKQLMEVE